MGSVHLYETVHLDDDSSSDITCPADPAIFFNLLLSSSVQTDRTMTVIGNSLVHTCCSPMTISNVTILMCRDSVYTEFDLLFFQL